MVAVVAGVAVDVLAVVALVTVVVGAAVVAGVAVVDVAVVAVVDVVAVSAQHRTAATTREPSAASLHACATAYAVLPFATKRPPTCKVEPTSKLGLHGVEDQTNCLSKLHPVPRVSSAASSAAVHSRAPPPTQMYAASTNDRFAWHVPECLDSAHTALLAPCRVSQPN